MDCNCGVHVFFGKEDIIKDCKYCRKTDKKGFVSHHAYGYECQLKLEKRRCNRCRVVLLRSAPFLWILNNF